MQRLADQSGRTEPLDPPPEGLAGSETEPAPLPASAESERRRRLAEQLFVAAGGALAVSTVLPWISAGPLASSHLSGVAVLYMLLFAAAYAAAAYMLHQRRETRRITIATRIVNVWMVLNVIVIYYAFARQGQEIITVSPAVGVFVAAAAVIAGISASVQLQRSILSPKTAAPVAEAETPAPPPPPPGAQLSADGRWWWDGKSWRQTPAQAIPETPPGPTTPHPS